MTCCPYWIDRMTATAGCWKTESKTLVLQFSCSTCSKMSSCGFRDVRHVSSMIAALAGQNNIDPGHFVFCDGCWKLSSVWIRNQPSNKTFFQLYSYIIDANKHMFERTLGQQCSNVSTEMYPTGSILNHLNNGLCVTVWGVWGQPALSMASGGSGAIATHWPPGGPSVDTQTDTGGLTSQNWSQNHPEQLYWRRTISQKHTISQDCSKGCACLTFEVYMLCSLIDNWLPTACYTLLYIVILCYTMLYYAILCYTMLYYVILEVLAFTQGEHIGCLILSYFVF